uniref:Uncharacterized protein n=1 Tax=Opuntia streptacantha TaxID=393608 RepID=A0A7C8ZMW4_OPUST
MPLWTDLLPTGKFFIRTVFNQFIPHRGVSRVWIQSRKVNKQKYSKQPLNENFTKVQVQNRPFKVLLHREDKVEHNSISYQSIDDAKSNKPSEFTNIHLSFYAKHDEHREPSKSLDDQRNHLIWSQTSLPIQIQH